MARQKVIVKHLEAIQNFGSMDVLCSDKTGTLTSGDTVLDLHVDPFGNAAERVFLLAYINSFFETGVESSLNKAVLQKAGASPLDLAIVKHDHPDIAHYQTLDEVPFDFERRRLSIIVKAGEDRLLAKGAPESVLAVCSEYELDGRTFPLDKDVQARYKGTYEALCTDGFRVLAVAYRKMPHQNRYSTADEHDLVLSGYLTFFDPPLEDAADILESLRRDGVAVKILTGDNELVARHICSRVGLDAGRIVVMRQYPRLG
jgi:Mg2+-importing ATPase